MMKPTKLPKISKWTIFGSHYLLLPLRAKVYKNDYLDVLKTRKECFLGEDNLLCAQIIEPSIGRINILHEKLNKLQSECNEDAENFRKKMHASEVEKALSELTAEVTQITQVFEARKRLVEKHFEECVATVLLKGRIKK